MVAKVIFSFYYPYFASCTMTLPLLPIEGYSRITLRTTASRIGSQTYIYRHSPDKYLGITIDKSNGQVIFDHVSQIWFLFMTMHYHIMFIFYGIFMN